MNDIPSERIHNSSFIIPFTSLEIMNRNRRIFIIVFIVFTTIVALLAIDMANRTTAPWNRRKSVERALPAGKDGTTVDTLALDTLLMTP